MKKATLRFTSSFEVVIDNAASQAAEMTLPPGESEGGLDNRHRGSDQWLYVVEGAGEAVIEGKTVALAARDILLIARGERHEIRNTGKSPLRTLSLYVPPAYTSKGDELPAGES
jgi:mannose-6-phosphate isomerase-like protein (cupin superfamily)